jgi:hypothetical protein
MRVHRVIAIGALVAGTFVAPAISGAPTAAATHADCWFYTFMHGHSGLFVDIACADGASGSQVLCQGSMRVANVPDDIALEACRRAALP